MYEAIHPVYANGTVAQLRNKNKEYINPPTTINVVQGNKHNVNLELFSNTTNTIGTGGIFMFGTGFKQPAPSWSAARNVCFSYGRMSVNASHVHYEQVCTDRNNDVLDEFWIVKH